MPVTLYYKKHYTIKNSYKPNYIYLNTGVYLVYLFYPMIEEIIFLV